MQKGWKAMGMNETPSSERLHIGIFGKRNAGKSSLINALTGQDLAIVSEVLGTTTDPVLKSMELLPLGPVVMIDTPGIDDEGELGALRVKKAYQMLNRCDIALLVVDAAEGMSEEDSKLLAKIRDKKIPHLVVMNKADLCGAAAGNEAGGAAAGGNAASGGDIIRVSAATKEGIEALKNRLGTLMPKEDPAHRLVGNLVKPMDFVVLVVPIDSAAPKGRLILPQQQVIRDVLETGAVPIVVRDTELADLLKKLPSPPDLVITDSQAFGTVSRIVPGSVLLTSFSILMARYKGDLRHLVHGARALDSLKDGDKVLISEGCTHHRQCGDIGTVKLPNWICNYSGKKLSFEFTSGGGFPDDLSPYSLIVHCGGCMLNGREMKYRMKCAADAGVPMTNYGTAIAYVHGILERSVQIVADEL